MRKQHPIRCSISGDKHHCNDSTQVAAAAQPKIDACGRRYRLAIDKTAGVWGRDEQISIPDEAICQSLDLVEHECADRLW